MTLQRFIRFLKDNDAYLKYVKNFNSYNKFGCINSKGFTDYFVTLYNKHEYSIIDYSFSWDCTPEGYNYWSRLDSVIRNTIF